MNTGQRWIVIAYVVATIVAVFAGYLVRDWHPIWVAAFADFVGTVVIFLFSWRLNNSSVYDAYWSVGPLPILVYWFLIGEGNGLRQLLVVVLFFAWAIRLTWNWWLRWRGLDDEDWRYADHRDKGSTYWAMSFGGFHLFPTVWVFLGMLPLYAALTVGTRPFSVLDVVATLVTILAIYLEARADNELRGHRTGNDSDKVFKSGLWAMMRHPNYLGEILFWYGMFLFGLSADFSYWWSLIGALLMTGLFRFVSIPLKEERMISRRPAYREETAGIPALFPKILK